MNADKDVLSNIILSLVDVAENSVQLLKSAAVTMEQLRSEQLSNQNSVIKLQSDLIKKQDELKSAQFDLNNDCQQMGNKLETVVKSVVKDNQRQKQIVLFGVSEESMDLGGTVTDILKCACGPDKPSVKEFCRIGAQKPGRTRPVKVCFNSQEDVQTTIRNAKSLKHSEKYGKVFIAPDRSQEERAERRELVRLLREKRRNVPEKHHYISRGEVCSTEHYLVNTQPCNAPSLSERDNLESILKNQFRMLEEHISQGMDRLDASVTQAGGI